MLVLNTDSSKKWFLGFENPQNGFLGSLKAGRFKAEAKTLKLEDLQEIVNFQRIFHKPKQQKLWCDNNGNVFDKKGDNWVCLGVIKKGEFQANPCTFNVSQLHLLAETLANQEQLQGWKQAGF